MPDFCASTLRQVLPVPIRAGLHTGEVELRGDDVGGIAFTDRATHALKGVPDERQLYSVSSLS